MTKPNIPSTIIAVLLTAFTARVAAQTGFTYQGRLNHGTNAATGLYEMQFSVYDAATSGHEVGIPVDVAPVSVNNGLFMVFLDFGDGVFTGPPRWLEITVNVYGSDQPTVLLSPRQPITASPYALHAANAAGLMTVGNAPLDIKVNGVRVMHYDASSTTEAPNIIGGFSGNFGVGGATIAGGGSYVFPNSVLGPYGTVGGGAGNQAGARPEPNVDHAWATVGGGLTNVASGDYSTIGGGYHNRATAEGTTIPGGFRNDAGEAYATVGGGLYNTTLSPVTVIAGGYQNRIESDSLRSTISGGASNLISGLVERSTIGGGEHNRIGYYANATTIAGGLNNFIDGPTGGSTISGGWENYIADEASVSTISGGSKNVVGNNAGGAAIGGGEMNTSEGSYGAIGGGFGNLLTFDASYGSVGGGLENQIWSRYSTIGGGNANLIDRNRGQGGDIPHADYSTIAGGHQNVIASGAEFSAIGGGASNHISGLLTLVWDEDNPGSEEQLTGDGATIAGGQNNAVAGAVGTVGGGAQNIARGDYATIAGGFFNQIDVGSFNNYGATIGGGSSNTLAKSSYVTIAGGLSNFISEGSFAATISGGQRNLMDIYSGNSFIGGGVGNIIGPHGGSCVIAGGDGNRIASFVPAASIGGGYANYVGFLSDAAAIAGGWGNRVADRADSAAIGGGSSNEIGDDSEFATVSGGLFNVVRSNAQYAVIVGGFDNLAAAPHSFAAGQRAQALHQGSFVWADSSSVYHTVPPFGGIPFASTSSNQFSVRASGGVRFVTDTNGTAGAELLPGSGAWSSLSDRNAKKNFVPVNGRAILDKVAELPMATWNYKSQDESVRHIGPTAQDFHVAFGVGENDRTITTIDADGVALAAIQGLNQKLEEQLKSKDARIDALEKELSALKQLVLKLVPNDR
jgi:hypothetical protein